MMGLDFFRRAVELERRYAQPGQRILNTMQTNGTLLDDEWGAFLRENDFLVGISIDGPARDARRLPRRQGRQAHLRPGAARPRRPQAARRGLERADHGQRRQRRPRRRVYRFLRDDLGATFIQFIPIVERATPETLAIADAGWGSGVHGRPLYTQQGSPGHPPHGRARAVRPVPRSTSSRSGSATTSATVYVQMFDTALANWVGEPGGMCVHAETCGEQLALEHNGDVYSCDHYVEPTTCSATSADRTLLELVALPAAAAFGAGQAGHAHRVLPGLRRPVRLQRRLPQGPVRDVALR